MELNYKDDAVQSKLHTSKKLKFCIILYLFRFNFYHISSNKYINPRVKLNKLHLQGKDIFHRRIVWRCTITITITLSSGSNGL